MRPLICCVLLFGNTVVLILTGDIIPYTASLTASFGAMLGLVMHDFR